MAKVRDRAPTEATGDSNFESVGLTDQETLECYTKMVFGRTLEERIWTLNRQGKVPIAASSQGHEAAQMGSLMAAQKDGDYFLFPYYRDVSLKIAAGLSVLETMLSFMGKEGEPYSGGRQFPLQGADLKHRIIQISNVVSAGITQAVGYAFACKHLGDSTVVLCYFGDGGSSQGECHEGMNFAGVHKLPIVFICENNKYAISVPQARQMSIQDVADRAPSYGFPGVVVDGMDLFQVFEATTKAIERARAEGPVLLEMKVERFMPHTTDDDDRRYRPKEEVDEVRLRDPLLFLRSYLMEAGTLSEKDEEQIQKQAKDEVNKATDEAESASYPDPSTVFDHVYAP